MTLGHLGSSPSPSHLPSPRCQAPLPSSGIKIPISQGRMQLSIRKSLANKMNRYLGMNEWWPRAPGCIYILKRIPCTQVSSTSQRLRSSLMVEFQGEEETRSCMWASELLDDAKHVNSSPSWSYLLPALAVLLLIAKIVRDFPGIAQVPPRTWTLCWRGLTRNHPPYPHPLNPAACHHPWTSFLLTKLNSVPPYQVDGLPWWLRW